MAFCLHEAGPRVVLLGVAAGKDSTLNSASHGAVSVSVLPDNVAIIPLKQSVSLKAEEPWSTSWSSVTQQKRERMTHVSKGSNWRSAVCESVLQQKREVSISTDEHILVKRKAQEVGAQLRGTSIFLVGMMGSGKTTVGRVLAAALDYCFFDSDSVVEQAAGGASVADIFHENGEEAFRDVESQAIAQLSSMCRLVVATGGGAVVRPANWGRMRDGITVWLNVPLEALAMRIAAAGTASRPKLGNVQTSHDSYSMALEKLSSIFEERQALYRPADAEVSLQGIAAEMGSVAVHTITPDRIALQVLEEIEKLIQMRKMEDNARRM